LPVGERSLCDPVTFGLREQVLLPLAGDLEMNGWM
jgi:hypothetical protein